MSLLTIFSTMMKRAGLVDRMAKTVGAKNALAQHPSRAALTRRAVTRCGTCDETSACKQWLSDHETADQAPGYCRNHDLFERLKKAAEPDMATTA